MTNWLLSSAGRRGELVRILQETPIIESGSSRVVTTDVSAFSAAGQLADAFELVARVTDPGFVPQTIEIAQRHDVSVIIPTIDPEIAVYAEHREQFTACGIDVWVSSPRVANLGWDKWELVAWATSSDIPIPETCELRAPQPLRGEVIAKPRNGSSGHGIVRASSLEALDLSALDDSYIIQSVARGCEITVDFAVGRDGDFLGSVQRRRMEVRGGEVSKGITVDYPAVDAAVRKVVSHLDGAYGMLNAQFFYDARTEAVLLIEINPRFGGGYPLSHYAGANFVRALADHARGKRGTLVSAAPGSVMLRYDSQVMMSGIDPAVLDV